jgi:UDP-N-acetyl-2-amino-2-deoxyglucuronate dehydrogenase
LTIKDNILTKLNEETGKKEEIIEDNKLLGEKFYCGASHGKLINQFNKSIMNNSSDYVHAKDALPSLQVIDAILKSSELNKAVKIESVINLTYFFMIRGGVL